MKETGNKEAAFLRDIVSIEQIDTLNVSSVGCSGYSGGSGSGSLGGACFFNVLSSIGATYKVKKTPEKLGKEYFEGGYGTKHEMENGPDTFKRNSATGEVVPNPNAYNFINGIFETKDNGWQKGETKLQEYTTRRKGEKSGKIMGVIDNGPNPGNSHAVIITGFQDGVIEYYDPTYHQRAESDVTKLKYFTMIVGAKEKEDENE